MKEKTNIKTKIAVVGIIALTLLIIGIISAPNVLQRMGVQVGEKEGEDAENVQVLVGKTFTSSLAGVGAAGAMADYTQNLQTAQIAANETGVSIVNIPAGYYEQIQVDATAVYQAGLSAGVTTHTETLKPTTRANNIDMGENHYYRYIDTTSVPNTNSGTYTASSRGASLDMGATNTYRYVNTNSVPNSNSGTLTLAASDTGTKDMGATNTYRYVNASNVYNAGVSAGATGGYKTSDYRKGFGNYASCSISVTKGSKYVFFAMSLADNTNGDQNNFITQISVSGCSPSVSHRSYNSSGIWGCFDVAECTFGSAGTATVSGLGTTSSPYNYLFIYRIT